MVEQAPAGRRNRLGRGLASLIGDNPAERPKVLPAEGEQRLVAIDRIRPGSQNPRKSFPSAELDELASSIREKGLVQPLIVRPHEDGQTFEIVAGERRWRAAQRAEMHKIPVIVRALSDQEALELAIIENVQRTDLNPIEEASGYQELIARFKYTQEELSQIIGKSRSHLANTLRLLKLPPGVQKMVSEGTLSAGHARALIGRDDAEEVARDIVKRGLTVREVEALSQAAKGLGTEAGAERSPGKDPDTRAFERELSDALGLAVALKPGPGETGELRIRYRTLDQLEGLRSLLMRS